MSPYLDFMFAFIVPLARLMPCAHYDPCCFQMQVPSLSHMFVVKTMLLLYRKHVACQNVEMGFLKAIQHCFTIHADCLK